MFRTGGGDDLAERGPVELDRERGAETAPALDDPGSRGDHARRFLEGQRARPPRRGDLAAAVTDDDLRRHAAPGQRLGEHDLDREDRDDEHRRVVGRRRGVEQQRGDGGPALGADRARESLEGRGGGEVLVAQRASHAGPLAAAAGEHPHEPAVVAGGLRREEPVAFERIRRQPDARRARGRRRRATVEELPRAGGQRGVAIAGERRAGVEPCDELGAVARDGDPALGARRAGVLRRDGVSPRQLGVVPQVAREVRADRRQRARRRGRQRDELGAIGSRPPARGRRLLDDDVGVGAADPERADPGAPDTAARLPRLQAIDDEERRRIERDPRVGRAEVDRRWQLAVLEREHGLDQAGHAGRDLEVTEVRLDRADRARSPGRGAERAPQRLDLDRVAELGPGAVRLDVGDRTGPDAGDLVRRRDHRGLTVDARRRERVLAGAVVVDRRAEHDRADRICRRARRRRACAARPRRRRCPERRRCRPGRTAGTSRRATAAGRPGRRSRGAAADRCSRRRPARDPTAGRSATDRPGARRPASSSRRSARSCSRR